MGLDGGNRDNKANSVPLTTRLSLAKMLLVSKYASATATQSFVLVSVRGEKSYKDSQ